MASSVRLFICSGGTSCRGKRSPMGIDSRSAKSAIVSGATFPDFCILSDHSIQFLLRLHVERQSGHAFEIREDRMQRTIGMERRALQTDDEMALRRNPARQGHAQSRLSNPCFARQQDHLTLAVARGSPSPKQQRQLILPANHFRQIGVVCSIEAAFGRRLAQHAPYRS